MTGEMASAAPTASATGDAVNVAARLEQAAQPGAMIVGEQTARLARNAIEVAPVEPLELKGKAKPHPAYVLLGSPWDGLPPFERRPAVAGTPSCARSCTSTSWPGARGTAAW